MDTIETFGNHEDDNYTMFIDEEPMFENNDESSIAYTLNDH